MVWTVAFGAFALVLALLGPIGFVRRFVRKVAVWAVPFGLLYLTWWALDGADLSGLWDQPGEGGLSVWQGADIVVAITVSFVPYAADYTRFSRTRRGAFLGTGIGYLIPDAWLLALGVVLVLSRDLSGSRGPSRGGRGRRSGRHPGAARTARHGDGRDVRERLLGGRLAPERRAAGRHRRS